jgi:hypothetical protein
VTGNTARSDPGSPSTGDPQPDDGATGNVALLVVLGAFAAWLVLTLLLRPEDGTTALTAPNLVVGVVVLIGTATVTMIIRRSRHSSSSP